MTAQQILDKLSSHRHVDLTYVGAAYTLAHLRADLEALTMRTINNDEWLRSDDGVIVLDPGSGEKLTELSAQDCINMLGEMGWSYKPPMTDAEKEARAAHFAAHSRRHLT